MAKGQMRSNRETKKPKQDKVKAVASTSPFATPKAKPDPASSKKK